jgi:hypothetical protein
MKLEKLMNYGLDLDKGSNGLKEERTGVEKTKAPWYRSCLLTPKIGTRKRLTCGPNLVEEHHSAEGFPQSIR